MVFMSRRKALWMGGAAAFTAMFPLAAFASAPLPAVTAFRAPGCGCCHLWAERMTAAGFAVTMEDDEALEERRARLGVPEELAGCHIALIGDHVFEGHVPPADIITFLASKPVALGLSVPGMPMGSPGMDTGGEAEPYDVIMFGRDGSRDVYARH